MEMCLCDIRLRSNAGENYEGIASAIWTGYASLKGNIVAKPKAKRQESQPTHVALDIPLLPVGDRVFFPHMVIPLFVGGPSSLKAIEESLGKNRMILLVAQRTLDAGNPDPDDLYKVGTVGMIMRMLKLPDGRVRILVHGLVKARILKFLKSAPFFYVRIRISKLSDRMIRDVDRQFCRVENFGDIILEEVLDLIHTLNHPIRISDWMDPYLSSDVEFDQKVLETKGITIKIIYGQ